MKDVAGVAAMAGAQEQRELASSQNPGGKSCWHLQSSMAAIASRAVSSGLGLGDEKRARGFPGWLTPPSGDHDIERHPS